LKKEKKEKRVRSSSASKIKKQKIMESEIDRANRKQNLREMEKLEDGWETAELGAIAFLRKAGRESDAKEYENLFKKIQEDWQSTNTILREEFLGEE